MRKTILCCDGCGTEIITSRNHYEINFDSGRFTDAAGSRDSDQIHLDLCESCTTKLTKTAELIWERLKKEEEGS